jgi:tRNA modification GTPase
MTLDGIPIRLVDTAGLRGSDCSIETEGVKRARELMSRGDLFLYIVDAALPRSKEDLTELASLPSEKVLVILNKSDLPQKAVFADFKGFDCVPCSVASRESQEKLRAAILHKIRPGEGSSGAHISERHRALLMSALSEIEKAASLLKLPGPLTSEAAAASASALEPHAAAENADLSLVAIHIRSALDSLGKITGKIYNKDLLDNIFQRFCIGK